MENSLGSRLRKAWDVFKNRDPTPNNFSFADAGLSYRPDRVTLTKGNERSIVTSIFNKIALDVASLPIKHCRLDENGNYIEDIDSGLNNCLTLEANIDQTGREFIHDIVLSMFDEGCVALVPTETDTNPDVTDSYEILSMRTGKILEWYPAKVKVRVYNEQIGKKQDIIMPKREVAIIENPLYAVVNEPNSTVQRLMRKLRLLDVTDEQTASGKLDLIIQLPYLIKTDARRQQAEDRRKDIEMQLTGSKYGIAYTDGTEKITQLNRSLENNLMKQVEYWTNLMYNQLGMSQSVLDGTADEKAMLNYNHRTIEPIVSAIVGAMKRTFLTKTARTQRQTIMFFTDPFKLVPVDSIADIADKFTRNEILSSNEIRHIIGLKPSSDPKADELLNSNLNHPEENMVDPEAMSETNPESSGEDTGDERDMLINELLNNLETDIDDIIAKYTSGEDDEEKDDEEKEDEE